VELGEAKEGLKEIAAISSEQPIFDGPVLQSLTWASHHYVAPLAVLLERAAPPNLPVDPGRAPNWEKSAPTPVDHPLAIVTAGVASRPRRPPAVLIGPWQGLEWQPALWDVLRSGRSAMVIAATVAEATHVAEGASNAGLPAVLAAGESGRVLTEAWSAAQAPARLVVGTPRVSTWLIPRLGMCVILEEGRRAMKDRQTPTIHVREMILTRARVEGFAVVFMGPTPSVETLAAGPEVLRVGSRAWPLVEVVDRREEPPGSGALGERAVAAIKANSNSGRQTFVFTHRRMSQSSMRCASCRRVRVCEQCGSKVGREDECRRCGHPTGPCTTCGGSEFETMASPPERLVAELNRRVDSGAAGLSPSSQPIEVGTERDLATLRPTDLVVVADADGLLLGHDYRTGEEALRILARVANSLRHGTGRRMMLQTSLPDAPLITTLRRGDPQPYLEQQLAERARHGFPPAVEMMAVEARGDFEPSRLDGELRATGTVAFMGPATSAHGSRWLIQGDLGKMKTELRQVVQRWRDGGITVRVDADPIDL
jgi:primosomal protein N' (replication factor Y) (superfamily II helicase)